MILQNVQIVGEHGASNILVNGEKIRSVTPVNKPVNMLWDIRSVEFDNALAFPGLINSHDHLDFNLFPMLGNRVYHNYTEWGKDIHDNNKKDIHAVLKIPAALRVQWGMYKNLLTGVTTVANHGKQLEINDPFITVLQNCCSLHSVAFERNWRYKLNKLFNAKTAYVMHIGEGTDAMAKQEIKTLLRWNLFNRDLIGIHGVAMGVEDASRFKAIVWCPASNFFLLNATASIDKLKQETQVLFGTDSTLTAGWNIWDHLRLARSKQLMDDNELFAAVTKNAANVWGLNSGRLVADSTADIVIATNRDASDQWEAFYGINPTDILLIMKAGRIVLFDKTLQRQLFQQELLSDTYQPIHLGGKTKFVIGELPTLATTIKKYHAGIVFPFE